MKSGLYSTFTIQSLQASPNPRPIKTELLIDPASKVDRTPREVRERLMSSRMFWINNLNPDGHFLLLLLLLLLLLFLLLRCVY